MGIKLPRSGTPLNHLIKLSIIPLLCAGCGRLGYDSDQQSVGIACEAAGGSCVTGFISACPDPSHVPIDAVCGDVRIETVCCGPSDADDDDNGDPRNLSDAATGGDSEDGDAGTPDASCCDPDQEPGVGNSPYCYEGATCCADGTWACNEGDGTAPCAAGNVCAP